MCTTTWLTNLRRSEAASGADHAELARHPCELTAYVQTHLDEAIRLLTRGEIEMPASGTTEAEHRDIWESARHTIVSQVVAGLDAAGKALVAMEIADSKLGAQRNFSEEAERSCPSYNPETSSGVIPSSLAKTTTRTKK